MRKQQLFCPNRDGVMMATDLYLPEGEGAWPLILLRTPYGKGGFDQDPLYSHYADFVAAGYVVAVQDCQGTGASGGKMNLNARNEHLDGYDAVEWLAVQPFCNGRVGMYGLSYFGFTQLAAASQRPPHLKAICPFMTLSQEPFGASRRQTLNLGHMYWAYGQLLAHAEEYMPDKALRERVVPQLQANMPRLHEFSLLLPMNENPAALVPDAPLLRDYLDLVEGIEHEEFWQSIRCPLDYSGMHAASLHATGWLDVACDATIDNYLAARNSRDEYTREHARLLIGHWTHGGVMGDTVDDICFGQENSGEAQDVSGMMLRWFDRYLKGETTDCFDGRVRYFMRGSNTWHTAEDWPPRGSVQRWHLAADRQLTKAVPAPGEAALTSDPMNPVPSAITDDKGRGPMADMSQLAAREDVLAFHTQPFEKDTAVAGSIRLVLTAVSDVPDADFACRVTDVDEHGRETQLCMGILRARHRGGMFRTDFIPVGETVTYEIEAGNTANLFRKGHRLGIQLSGSLYPAHNRNLHTTENPSTGKTFAVAHHRVLFGGASPSFVEIPLPD